MPIDVKSLAHELDTLRARVLDLERRFEAATTPTQPPVATPPREGDEEE